MQFIILRAAFYSIVWLQQYFTNDITYDIYIFTFTALFIIIIIESIYNEDHSICAF